MDIQIVLENFGHSPVMFFFLGLLVAYVKSDLEIPPQIGANNCEEAVRTLSTGVMRCGEEPDTGGTTSGALHRIWPDIKTALLPIGIISRY